MSLPVHAGSRAVNTTDRPPRSWAQRRFSSFFHGESVFGSSRKRVPHRLQMVNASSPRYYSTQSSCGRSGLSLPISFRSLINPFHSHMNRIKVIPSRTLESPQRNSHNTVQRPTIPRRACTGIESAERGLALRLSPAHPQQLWTDSAEKRRRRRCLPTLSEPKIRKKAFGCMWTGGILVVMLMLYLVLKVLRHFRGQAWNVTLIVLILVTTAIFCHFVIRLYMLVLKARKQDRNSRGLRNVKVQEDGFAQLESPIRVIMTRDEELSLSENDDVPINRTVVPPPPAYGLWRSSVRADPNLIYWRRNSRFAASNRAKTSNLSETSSTRPPSYVSDNGLGRVDESTTVVQLPPSAYKP